MELEAILKRDRLVMVVPLAGVVVVSWLYILSGAGMNMTALDMTRASTSAGFESTAMSGGRAAGTGLEADMMAVTMLAGARPQWMRGYAVLMFFMWWIMMFGMMLPSASPILLLYARLMRTQREKRTPYVRTSTFALGYVLTWATFSALATDAQWGLERSGLLSTMMVSTSPVFGTVLLIAAGLWQFTPIKYACLQHCRSPVGFLFHYWRPDPGGAFRMGLMHGGYCLGCCWFLMTLLFYGGVMNLYWIIGLALFILVEKLLPEGARIGRLTGAALIVWGGVLLLGEMHL